MKKSLWGLSFILAIQFVGIGCAFGNRHVILVYPPEQAEKVRAATAAEASDPPLRPKVLLVVMLDQRSNKQAIGAVHNGFGMHTANVIATNNVAEWVTGALRTELEKAGFDVVQVAGSQSAADDAVMKSSGFTAELGRGTKPRSLSPRG